MKLQFPSFLQLCNYDAIFISEFGLFTNESTLLGRSNSCLNESMKSLVHVVLSFLVDWSYAKKKMH
jgi:hypothetical protein